MKNILNLRPQPKPIIIEKVVHAKRVWWLEALKMITVVVVVSSVVWGVSKADISDSNKSAPAIKNFSALGNVVGVTSTTLSIDGAHSSDQTGKTAYTFDLSDVKKIENGSYVPLLISDINVGDKVVVQGIEKDSVINIRRIISLSSTATTTAVVATTTVATTVDATTTATSTTDVATTTTDTATSSDATTTASSTLSTSTATTDVTASSTTATSTASTTIASTTVTTTASTTQSVASSTNATATDGSGDTDSSTIIITDSSASASTTSSTTSTTDVVQDNNSSSTDGESSTAENNTDSTLSDHVSN